MSLNIEKAAGTGFCFGVNRAIDILEKIARERGPVETLGAVVHNQQVSRRLADIGITVAGSIDDIKGKRVAIGAHGIGPKLEEELRRRYEEVINTTCPFVHRAQIAARRLAESDFWVVIYGDADHREVKGIMAWANNQGIATLDDNFTGTLARLPRRLGVLSQTTQVPAHFNEFVKKLIDSTLVKDSELRIIDTICHDIRERQQAALDLAAKVDLMLVIGSQTSANTKHLTELCATVTETRLVETGEDIQPTWLRGHHNIGVASGASTAEETINGVLDRLATLA